MDLADLRGFGFHLGDQFVHLVEYRLTRFTLRQIDPHLLQLLHRFVIGMKWPPSWASVNNAVTVSLWFSST
jgi:hypothetical protein